ncbi:glycosyltransferase family 2 protein [Clostridium perfringens]|nr:glycosyltransferase family 2 protein [Clostridium perfringens]
MKKDLISIIVPVYQSEKYLYKCIESIVTQTYENIEIILIDDGSTDDSKKIYTEFEKVDKRIKVIRQSNKGLSATRNVGISLANGRYITFIDSDDYIERNFIEDMYINITSTNSDICVCNIVKEYIDYGTRDCGCKIQKNKVFDKYEAMKSLLDINNGFGGYACNKMYDISLFRDIKFPEGRIYEDTFTIYKLIDLAKKIVYTKNTQYIYTIRKGSITSKDTNVDKKLDFIRASRERYEFINDKYRSLSYLAYESYLISFISVYNEYILNRKINTDINNYKNDVLNLYKNYYKCINIKYKVIIYMLSFNKKIYELFIKIIYIYKRGFSRCRK